MELYIDNFIKDAQVYLAINHKQARYAVIITDKIQMVKL